MERYSVTLQIGGKIPTRKLDQLLDCLQKAEFLGSSGEGDRAALKRSLPTFWRQDCSFDRGRALQESLHELGLDWSMHWEAKDEYPALIQWQTRGKVKAWDCCSPDGMKPHVDVEKLRAALAQGASIGQLIRKLEQVAKLRKFEVVE